MYQLKSLMKIIIFQLLILVRRFVRGVLFYVSGSLGLAAIGIPLLFLVAGKFSEVWGMLFLLIPSALIQVLIFKFDDLIVYFKPDNREIQFLD
ncbi:hypothetical protein [Photobacterium damselae]|uniref:hypothetical protein n=1 Tax=Photobacterium damselae TaxID=38293 RepID=UPI001EFC3BE8|nr:hypothetical protein [Photobacterium damselae]MCG9706468.1 hypothetical protein [Photobacterium damselae]